MQNLYKATGKRLTQAERANLLAKGLYIYDRRDCGREESIEPHVAVDYLETIITNFEINFPTEGPSAYVIYDGDAYLKSADARQVYSIEELTAKDREWFVEFGIYLNGHIAATLEASVTAANEPEALEAASVLAEELEAKDNAEHPEFESTYMIEELY